MCSSDLKYTGYDLVVASNLLEELSDPKLFLSHIDERINDGGHLVILSAYDWTASKTPRDKWIGGYKEDGEPVTSFDGLNGILGDKFELLGEPFDMPLSIRKSSRVTENKVLEATIWKKKYLRFLHHLVLITPYAILCCMGSFFYDSASLYDFDNTFCKECMVE